MKSKKGFTLIELLAIIVILAIIAVITVPIILNIIEDSQKGAAKDSAYGFKDSLNKFYVSELAKDPHFHLEDGTYTVSEVNGSAVLTGTDNYTISLSGTVPTSGTIVIENNDIVGGNVQIGDYCIDLSNMEVTKGECGDTPTVQATPEECFEYEDNGNNTVTITGYTCGATCEWVQDEYDYFTCTHVYGDVYISDVVIPDKIDEKNVTVIGDNAFDYSDISSAIIPNGVTYIGASAFASNQLTSVEIPNSVTYIEQGAFFDNQLTSVIIPNSVTTIGLYAFSGNQLTSIEIPSSVIYIGDSAFASNQLNNIIINDFSNLEIGDGAFMSFDESNPDLLDSLSDEVKQSILNINSEAFALQR